MPRNKTLYCLVYNCFQQVEFMLAPLNKKTNSFKLRKLKFSFMTRQQFQFCTRAYCRPFMHATVAPMKLPYSRMIKLLPGFMYFCAFLRFFFCLVMPLSEKIASTPSYPRIYPEQNERQYGYLVLLVRRILLYLVTIL